ncbi:MAG TPA: 16S rRNA (guanine(527)-N(7))-methyltransferase RsmG [Capillimicrobium sp.]|jgi:16S rRNA (guanine527-N7)-methyltransferase
MPLPPPWTDRLDALAAEHALPPSAPARLRALLELVRDDTTAPTTVTDPAQGVDAHVADSLDGLRAEVVRAAGSIADLGAGAGFPGLPLAIARPDARVHLVESLSRKCAFLERAVEAAQAPNAAVACARAEEWPERDLDVVIARAVAPLAVLVEYAAPLLRVGGSFVAWKGRRDDDEERGGSEAAAMLGLEPGEILRLPPREGAEHRHLHLYLKVGPTPGRFPRRAGMARKRPLSG